MRPTGKVLTQAGFKLAPSGYRSDALSIELLSPTEKDVLASQYRFIMFICCPEDDSNRVEILVVYSIYIPYIYTYITYIHAYITYIKYTYITHIHTYILNNYTIRSRRIWSHSHNLSIYYMDKYGIFGVVLSSNSLISCSFTLAKRSVILFVFFTTNRIWSDSLLVKEPIKLHNSSYTVFVYIINT